MSCVKTSIFNILQIGHDYFLVHNSSIMTRSEVMDRVKITYVHSSLIWLRALVTIFVDIHSKQYYILAINALEEYNTFRSAREFSRVSLVLVPISYSFTYLLIFVDT